MAVIASAIPMAPTVPNTIAAITLPCLVPPFKASVPMAFGVGLLDIEAVDLVMGDPVAEVL